MSFGYDPNKILTFSSSIIKIKRSNCITKIYDSCAEVGYYRSLCWKNPRWHQRRWTGSWKMLSAVCCPKLFEISFAGCSAVVESTPSESKTSESESFFSSPSHLVLESESESKKSSPSPSPKRKILSQWTSVYFEINVPYSCLSIGTVSVKESTLV